MRVVAYDTKVINIDPLNPSLEVIEAAATWIKAHEVVGFPTETVYGLGADATNDTAVSRIYKAKNRPADNPLIAHFTSLDMIAKYVKDMPEIAYKLAEIYWPGPLTMVLMRNDRVSSLVTQGLDTLAVRIPAHQVALSLIEVSDVPIVAPSANLSGMPSPTTAAHVYNDLKGKIPLILDAGSTSIGVESTVINIVGDQTVLLRPGGITVEELKQFIPDLVVPNQSREVVKPVSPGMKYKHYSPNTELVLLKNGYKMSAEQIDRIIETQGDKGIILCTNSKHVHDHEHIPLGSTLREVQINLFAALRLLDQKGYTVGLVEEVPPVAEGFTIMNRLNKAVHRIY